ncbi:MAG: hypothetical protein U1F64_04610 [Burkholderiales bacterium]
MTQLFSTLSRAALVAIGLSAAPAAFAQGTLSCPTGFTPLVNGNEVTCQMACATGTPTPTINGSSLSFTCSGGGGGDVAPSGCKITASPSSGSSATDVSLTLSCTGGTLPINVAWQGAAPGNCPSGTGAMDALTKNCTVPGVSQTTTWTVSQFSNSVGNGTGNANKSASFTFQQGGGGSGEYALCNAAGVSVAQGFKYPARNVYTNGYGSLGLGDGLVFKMVVTSLRSGGGQWSGNYGGVKEWALTTTACDFSGATTVQGQQGRATDFNVYYRLSPGTYYFNVREVQGCGGGDCSMNGKLD